MMLSVGTVIYNLFIFSVSTSIFFIQSWFQREGNVHILLFNRDFLFLLYLFRVLLLTFVLWCWRRWVFRFSLFCLKIRLGFFGFSVFSVSVGVGMSCWYSSLFICWCISSILVPDIGMMVRVFANVLGDLGSIPGRVIAKTQKMVLDATLLNTQHCKGKVEQFRERSSTLPYTSV